VHICAYIYILHLCNALYCTKHVSWTYSFWKWASLHIAVVCFVDNTMLHQLSKLQQKVPDTCHNMWKGHDISGIFCTNADERLPGSTVAVKPTNWHFCLSNVTGMLLHSLYVNLLRFYHCLLSVPANHNWVFFYELALWYCFYEAKVWSECLSLIFCKFVRGAARFLMGALHPLVTPWLQACK